MAHRFNLECIIDVVSHWFVYFILWNYFKIICIHTVYLSNWYIYMCVCVCLYMTYIWHKYIYKFTFTLVMINSIVSKTIYIAPSKMKVKVKGAWQASRERDVLSFLEVERVVLIIIAWSFVFCCCSLVKSNHLCIVSRLSVVMRLSDDWISFLKAPRCLWWQSASQRPLERLHLSWWSLQRLVFTTGDASKCITVTALQRQHYNHVVVTALQ